MATLKAAVRTKRKDGMYVVYIRVTHNRQVKYVRTSWMVDDKGLSRDKQDVIDSFVSEQTSKVIAGYYRYAEQIGHTELDCKGNR